MEDLVAAGMGSGWISYKIPLFGENLGKGSWYS